MRFDYTSLDPGANRLYIAHMDASELLVFDVRTRRVIKTIPAPGVHGVIAVPQLRRVYASATDAREVMTLDSRSGKVIARAPAGQYPDGLAYDPVERHVFVSDESGGVETVSTQAGIASRRSRSAARPATCSTTRLGPRPRGRADAERHRRDRSADEPRRSPGPASRLQSRSWPLVDPSRRLAFVACDGNARLLTLDLRRMKVIGSASVGGGPDVLAFDSSLRRLYVAAESGEVAVFAERAHGLTKLGQADLAPYAHTVAVDPRTHLVYFPLSVGRRPPQLLIMRAEAAGAACAVPGASIRYGVAVAKSISRLSGCGGATPVHVIAANAFVEAMPL